MAADRQTNTILKNIVKQVNPITVSPPHTNSHSSIDLCSSSKDQLHTTSKIIVPANTIIADTGATGHYLMVDGPYTNATPVSQGIDVLLPSGQKIRSSHTAEISLPGLPPTAIQCHIFPDLIARSLLSIGQLCDHGCEATFSATTVTILHDNIPIITGFRCPLTKLWTINLEQQQTSPHITTMQKSIDNHSFTNPHIALAASTTVAEQVAFMHATLCSPVISTWCNAIDKGYFPTWPTLTSKQIRKHAPFSPPMIKGHMDQVRSNQRSTSTPPPGLTPPS